MLSSGRLSILLTAHVIGAISSVIFCIATGIFEEAKKTGDGFRTAKPSDIMFDCLVLWEIYLLIIVMLSVKNYIDNINGKYYIY